ncbi:MAG TPA: hypothetical protein VK911_05145 [Vicinamibacterales bacterium]|nr:hypothetical protein [Vicinamibacterales bacterium]
MRSARGAAWLRTILAVAVLAAVLAYLRDPPWVGAITSGLRAWRQDAEGTRFRWTNGHATFYVPAAAASMTLPLRAGVTRPQGAATVTVLVDGRWVGARRLEDPGQWESLTVPLDRQPATRRFRRVEVRVDEVAVEGNLGVQLGEVALAGR